MRFHPIFQKPYLKWWLIMSILSIIKFIFFGLPNTYENKNYGYLFYTFGALLTALIFGSILYLIYRLFRKEWNNKIYMILISVVWLFFLIAQKPSKKVTENNTENIEFKDYNNLTIKLNDNRYYHSEINNFRVQLPENWILEKGQALGIEFNSVSPDNASIFSMQIANLNDEQINIENLPDDFFLTLAKSNRVSDMRILEKNETTIANQKAKHCIITFSYDHLNEINSFYLESYVFIYENKAYHLICKSKIGSEKIHAQEFNSILNSFMLENYS